MYLRCRYGLPYSLSSHALVLQWERGEGRITKGPSHTWRMQGLDTPPRRTSFRLPKRTISGSAMFALRINSSCSYKRLFLACTDMTITSSPKLPALAGSTLGGEPAVEGFGFTGFDPGFLRLWLGEEALCVRK